MPQRDTESKIVIPKWMWGLGCSVVAWAAHQSVELAVIRGSQTQILTRLDRLEEKTWQLRGGTTGTRTAAFSALSPADSSKPSPFPAGPLPSEAESIDATCRPHCEAR